MLTMNILLMIILTLFSNCFRSINSLTTNHNKSVLLDGNFQTYCDLKCGSEPKHTMCKPEPEPSNECENFMYFNVEMYMDETWHGHNGLRNRAAEKYHVSNMRRMEWDEELADMAKYWLMKCKKYERDPCTMLHKDKSISYTQVNQNTYFLVSKYLPQYFFPMVLRKWYMERRSMPQPEMHHGYVYFPYLNNFTQIVWSETWRIGCAAGKYSNGFVLICNYHGITTEKDSVWRLGKKCSKCPRNLPMCSQYFEHLCTADLAINHNAKPILVTILTVATIAYYYLYLIK